MCGPERFFSDIIIEFDKSIIGHALIMTLVMIANIYSKKDFQHCFIITLIPPSRPTDITVPRTLIYRNSAHISEKNGLCSPWLWQQVANIHKIHKI